MPDFPASIAAYGQAKLHNTSNLCRSQLGGSISGLPSTFTIQSATASTPWASATFVCLIQKSDGTNSELVYVTSRTGTTLTIGARGLGGTSAVDHDATEFASIVQTSELLQYIVGEVVSMQSWAGIAATLVHASVTTTPYTATTSDYIIPVDATAANATVNFPTAVGIKGRRYTVIKTDSGVNTVTLDPNSTETISGNTTLILGTQNSAITIVSDGANWLLESGNPGYRRNKYDATVAPTATDDTTKGYRVGSLWVNVTAGNGYICTTASTGAAVWKIVGSVALTLNASNGPSSAVATTLNITSGFGTKTTGSGTTTYGVQVDAQIVAGRNLPSQPFYTGSWIQNTKMRWEPNVAVIENFEGTALTTTATAATRFMSYGLNNNTGNANSGVDTATSTDTGDSPNSIVITVAFTYTGANLLSANQLIGVSLNQSATLATMDKTSVAKRCTVGIDSTGHLWVIVADGTTVQVSEDGGLFATGIAQGSGFAPVIVSFIFSQGSLYMVNVQGYGTYNTTNSSLSYINPRNVARVHMGMGTASAGTKTMTTGFTQIAVEYI